MADEAARFCAFEAGLLLEEGMICMKCDSCGSDNVDESAYCKVCGVPLSKSGPEGESEGEKPSNLAMFLAITWSRRGPIIIALFIVLMMAMVFAPWAFIRLEVLGLTLVSRDFAGWDIFVPRVLFFLSLIPLVISLLMVAGITTRRQVVETHLITFFSGVMFTVWAIIFALSQIMKVLIKNLKVIEVIPAGAQIATLLFMMGLIFGIILTSYDRGRLLAAAGQGG